MRVLFVVGGLPFGGIENLLFDVSKEFLKRGIPFKVVNLSGTGQKEEEFREAGIPVVDLGSSLKDIKTFKLKTAGKLKKLIEEERADVVHSMQFPADYFTRVALLTDRRVKVITHIHTTKRERRFERRVFNRLLSARTDAFLSVSEAVYRAVEKEHNIFGKPHYVMYNGINFLRLAERAKEKVDLNINIKDKKLFIVVGRLVPMKRVDLAIRALSIISRKHQEAALLIVGEGKERKKLEKLAEELSIKNRVIFTGYRKNVAPYLFNSYALLMPSEYEGFPVTHIEAAFFGLPAIISPFVPSKEVFARSSLIAPLSAEEIAKRMELLLTDNRTYRRLSEAASQEASRYSIEAYADALLDLYEGLTRGKLPEKRVLF